MNRILRDFQGNTEPVVFDGKVLHPQSDVVGVGFRRDLEIADGQTVGDLFEYGIKDPPDPVPVIGRPDQRIRRVPARGMIDEEHVVRDAVAADEADPRIPQFEIAEGDPAEDHGKKVQPRGGRVDAHQRVPSRRGQWLC